MKPPPFLYRRPESLEEAVSLLAGYGGEAKLLAGGQSLVPLLNFRMVRPAVLVDLNRLTRLAFVEEHAGGLRIGALTRHHALETSPVVAARYPVLSAAMAHVAHLAVRNRGTIGGSLAHADPAAELPLMAVLLDAEIRTAGGRRHAAAEFFRGPLATALAEDEIVTEIALPAPPPHAGWGFEEMALRHGDFAIAAVAATIGLQDGAAGDVRLAAGGVGERPLRLTAVEAGLAGQRLTPARIEAAAREAAASVDPGSDLRASAAFRRHLVAALTGRALTAAWRRAVAGAA